MLYYLFALIAFSLLVLGHEFGHYITARMFGVTVYEFSVGMGPKIFTYTSKKTNIKYSLRWIPIGGYVSMAGEDAECDDPNSLNKKHPWKRIVILAAGGVMNIILGVILMFSYVIASPGIGSNVIHSFNENSVSAHVLKENDKIVSVNGASTSISSALLYEIMWSGGENESFVTLDENGSEITIENVTVMDLTVVRNGETLKLKVPFANEEYEGVNFGTADFKVWGERKTFSNVMKHTVGETGLAAVQVWESLVGIITGRFGIQHLSGPVGVTEAVGESIKVGIAPFLFILGLISVNLGLVNLLPIPALDGGRLVFQFIELIFRKSVNREIEARIHAAALIILFGFIIIVTCKDVVRLF
ncbi:MAG: site-2 protease family protein [Clostridia bacterium]|nr:site-2 protease family protein [Clostridia bacterium]